MIICPTCGSEDVTPTQFDIDFPTFTAKRLIGTRCNACKDIFTDMVQIRYNERQINQARIEMTHTTI